MLGVVLLAVAGFLALDRMIGGTTTTSQTFDAPRVVELVTDGRVTVTTGGSDVDVQAIARSGIRSPRFSSEMVGDRLVITHECSRRFGLNLGRCSGALEVTLPADTEVITRVSNGAVSVSGLSGDVDLRTSNGRIEATNIGGRLQAVTSNGAINALNVDGDAHLRSSNGRIDATRIGGALDAQTSNGAINANDIGLDARVQTSNGRVDVAAVAGNVSARSSNGAVTVRGTGEPVRLTISTTNGRQTVEGATSPDAARTVEIRSTNGAVAFLGP